MHLDARLCSVPFRNRWTRAHPAEKILFSAGLLLLTLTSPAGGLLALAAGTIAAVRGAGVPAAAWWRFVRAPLTFALTGLVTMSIRLPLALDWNPDLWIAILARSLGSAAAAGFLGLTTPMDQVFHVLGRLGTPPAFTALLHAIYRFIFTMFDSLSRMLEATARRNLAAGWKPYLNALSLLAGSLLLRGLRQAARKEEALEWRLGGASTRMLATWRVARGWVIASQCGAFALSSAGLLTWRLL